MQSAVVLGELLQESPQGQSCGMFEEDDGEEIEEEEGSRDLWRAREKTYFKKEGMMDVEWEKATGGFEYLRAGRATASDFLNVWTTIVQMNGGNYM